MPDTKDSPNISVDKELETAVTTQETTLHEVYRPGIDTSEIDDTILLRKLDLRLIPWLSVLYFLSSLDRTSLGNAKLYHWSTDLRITDNRYLLCLIIFYFGYVLFEVPSNVLLKRLRPSIWLSVLLVLWGCMMVVQGLVPNFSGFMATRWWLGVFEAGLFPGVNFYLSCWYKRSELGVRAAVFFSAGNIAGAFSGLLADAIANMEGVGGKPAWAWIFILEGIVTVVAGILSFWIVQDFPDTARFLTDAERIAVIRRLQPDDQFSAIGEKFRWKYIVQSLADWKTWVGMLCYAGCNAPLYAFSLFLPSIISRLGYQDTPADLLTVPVYVCASIVTCIIGFLADKQERRGLFNLISLSLGAVGYIILVSSRSPKVSYFATYLAAGGIYPAILSNNVEGSYKRSVTLAMVISFGNINGIVSINIYRAKDRPWFLLGKSHGIVLMYIGIGLVATLILNICLTRENVRREKGLRDEIIGDGEAKELQKNGRFASVAEAKREKGDAWSGYRYIS
ncbi:MFS general substrate transporter [Flagelloscypha sp. PMI_526]|nr:MFS general substrate transporter [Flagelloscypha sp. PMI_526]